MRSLSALGWRCAIIALLSLPGDQISYRHLRPMCGVLQARISNKTQISFLSCPGLDHVHRVIEAFQIFGYPHRLILRCQNGRLVHGRRSMPLWEKLE